MDINKNSYSNGISIFDIVIETKLNAGEKELKSVFEVLIEQKRLLKQKFVSIKPNRLLFGQLPALSNKLVKIINASEKCLTEESWDLFTRIIREKRKIFLIFILGKCHAIVQSDIKILISSKIHRYQESRTIVPRRVDFDIFLSLLVLPAYADVELIKDHKHVDLDNEATTQQITQSDDLNHTHHDVNRSKQTRTEKLNISPVAPRKAHEATAVPLETKYTFPNDPPTDYKLPKYPIQATEVDAGQLSLEPSIRNRTANDFQRNQISASSGLNPPRFSDYAEKRQRLASFATPNWTGESKPAIDSLAEFGFFYTGNNDLVRCHQCGIGLKDWIKDDDVLNEHVKHSSDCEFLIQKIGPRRVNQIKAALAGYGNPSVRDSVVSNDSPPLPYRIRTPRYQTMEARLASFKYFPGRISIPRQEMAVSGLYYTGDGDLCRCFTCDGGLKDWCSGDDPIKEHAKYFPNCAYIISLKGTEYAQACQGNRNTPVGASGGHSTITQPTQPTSYESGTRGAHIGNTYRSHWISQVVQRRGFSELDVITARSKLETKGNAFPTAEEIINTIQEMNATSETVVEEDDIHTLLEENKRLTEQVYCKLCITNEADILFLPCTHHRICHECASDITVCPICNRPVREKVKTFRS